MMSTKANLKKSFLSLLTLITTISCSTTDNSIIVDNLKVDGESVNIGVDSNNPMLRWTILSKNGTTQKNYRVIVSSDFEKISQNIGDVWDSGKQSSKSANIVYEGEKLVSNEDYFWKVKIWSDDNKNSNWSDFSKFETAIMADDQWVASWINDGKLNPTVDEDFYKEDPAPLFRKEFSANSNIESAKLYITGLGYYVAYINGMRIGTNGLNPGWTDYDQRVHYSSYDVKDLITKGENCMGVALGNGWFNPLPLKMWGGRNIRTSLFVGRPSFISQLHIKYADGREDIISSDESWKVTEGPVRRNSIYLGEEYDARKEVENWNVVKKPGGDWRAAKKSDLKFGKLQSQPLEPIRVTEEIYPVAITNPSKGTYIVDMGENFVGVAKFLFNAEKGTKIDIRYGELLTEDGELNPLTSVCGQIKNRAGNRTESIGGKGAPLVAWQGDSYIAKGNSDEYMPNFTFHGFRYIEIKGLKQAPNRGAIVGYRMHSDVSKVGEFRCSNELLNQIQEMCTNTFVSNIISVQSDCPHRERFGYGGDIVATNEAYIYNFDMSRFYAKATNDWLDSRIDGVRFTDTAPFVGVDYCGLGWAMANPLLQYQLYRYYGNRQLVEDNYDAAKAWLEQIITDNPDNIIKKGLNDHEGLTRQATDVMVTALYYQTVDVMEYLASVMNRSEDVAKYNALKNSISQTYTEKFFNKESGQVGDGTQATEAFALYTGVVGEQYEEVVMKYLVNDIKNNHNNHLSTGIMATKFMLELLSKYGYHDVAMTLATNEDYPSWGNMLKGGATTLWEHWSYSDDVFSHNHPMFGSISEWFYKWLGGIQLDSDGVGFDKIIINPQIDKTDLAWVNSSYNSVNGVVVSNWTKNDNTIVMEVEIPSNTTATIIVPSGSDIKVEGDATPIKECGDCSLNSVAYSVKPGKCKFTTTR